MTETPDDLEQLREEKLRELQAQQQATDTTDTQDTTQSNHEAQKQAILRQYLTDDARQRLNTIRMSKPEFADQVETQLVALAQRGRLTEQLDDDQLKDLLQELQPESQSFNIRRR